MVNPLRKRSGSSIMSRLPGAIADTFSSSTTPSTGCREGRERDSSDSTKAMTNRVGARCCRGLAGQDER